jgi:ABC-2 type transport system permease protein
VTPVAAALVIAGKDLRQRLRDRSAIVLGFIAPVLIAGVMSAAFAGTEGFNVTLGVVDEDGGPLADALADVLASPQLAEIVTVQHVEEVASARRQVADGDLDAALVVPEGFSAAATSSGPTEGGSADLVVLGSVDANISATVAEAIASGFTAQVEANRLSVVTALAAGAPADELPEMIEAATVLRLPLQVVDQPAGSRPLRPIEYYGPSMAIFFVLFAVGFGARAFFLEQSSGTLDRIAAAPVSPAAVLAGKVLSVAVFASASLAVALTFSALALGADWGNPLAVAALCAVTALAVTALTALITAVGRSERQVEGIASMVVFGLGIAGGNFILVSAAPEALRRLALLTPNGWALRGFTDLATGQPSGAAVVAPVLAILAFTVVTGAAAALLSRRLLIR